MDQLKLENPEFFRIAKLNDTAAQIDIQITAIHESMRATLKCKCALEVELGTLDLNITALAAECPLHIGESGGAKRALGDCRST